MCLLSTSQYQRTAFKDLTILWVACSVGPHFCLNLCRSGCLSLYFLFQFHSVALVNHPDHKKFGGGKQISYFWLIFPDFRPSLREIGVGIKQELKQKPCRKAACCPVMGPCFARFLYSLRAPDQGMLLPMVGWTFVYQSTIRTISHQPI